MTHDNVVVSSSSSLKSRKWAEPEGLVANTIEKDSVWFKNAQLIMNFQ